MKMDVPGGSTTAERFLEIARRVVSTTPEQFGARDAEFRQEADAKQAKKRGPKPGSAVRRTSKRVGGAMDCKLGLVADYANITADGKLNVIGIFDRIRSTSYPATHPSFHLVLRFEANAAEKGLEKNVCIQLLDEDGNPILRLDGRMVVPTQPGPTVEMGQVVAIQMLNIPRPGEYAFHVLIDGDTKHTIRLRAELVEAPPQEEKPPLGL